MVDVHVAYTCRWTHESSETVNAILCFSFRSLSLSTAFSLLKRQAKWVFSVFVRCTTSHQFNRTQLFVSCFILFCLILHCYCSHMTIFIELVCCCGNFFGIYQPDDLMSCEMMRSSFLFSTRIDDGWRMVMLKGKKTTKTNQIRYKNETALWSNQTANWKIRMEVATLFG